MREVWLIVRKRSSDCIEVRFGVILLLTSEDWDMWDNITNRWVYLMLGLGRSGEQVGICSDFNGDLTKVIISFRFQDNQCLKGGQ